VHRQQVFLNVAEMSQKPVKDMAVGGRSPVVDIRFEIGPLEEKLNDIRKQAAVQLRWNGTNGIVPTNQERIFSYCLGGLLLVCAASESIAASPPDAGQVLDSVQPPVLPAPSKSAPPIEVELPAKPAMAPSSG